MSVKIIDISFWQQNVDYALLAQNIDGVILRAAYGTSKDTWFDRHYNGFSALGLPIGAYHYVIGSQSAGAQSVALRDAVAGKTLKLGVWNDVEDTREGTALNRTLVLDYHRMAEELLGTDLGVYTSRYKWDTIMGKPDLADKKLWIANYGVSSPSMPIKGGWSAWWLWQYTDREQLPGHGGGLDANKFNGTREQYNAWVGGVPNPPLTKLYYPCDPKWRITQLFGLRPTVYTISRGHNGVDWGIPVGNPIY